MSTKTYQQLLLLYHNFDYAGNSIVSAYQRNNKWTVYASAKEPKRRDDLKSQYVSL